MRKVNWKVLIFSLIIVYLVAFVGSLFNSGNTNSEWYSENKPFITPPNFVFPIVWNILFFMISLSLYFSWISANKTQKKKIAIVFGINLFLNVFWSFLFFKMQNPILAFVDLILLVVSIIVLIFTTYKIRKISSYLLIPYLVWVIFAGILNLLWII